MKTILKRTVPFILVLAMVFGLGLHTLAENEIPYCYTYVLLSRTAPQGSALLDLYVTVTRTDEGPADPDHPAGPLLDAGAFGLRFPDWLKGRVTFAPDAKISLYDIVPEERLSSPGMDPSNLYGDSYHAFNWAERMEDSPLGTISKSWEYRPELNAYSLCLGRYTISLPPVEDAAEGASPEWRLPYNTDVGLLDWLTIPEAVAKEVWDTVAQGNDALNRTIWNPDTKLYQGYYADPAADPDVGAPPVQTDIGFRFKAPETWPSGNAMLTLQSYDPKKPVTIELHKWDDTGKYNEAADYTLAIAGEPSGSGLCRQTIGFADAQFTYVKANSQVQGSNLPNGKYMLVLRKTSHVSANLIGVTISRDGGELSLFPQLDGKSLTLPCGDVNQDGMIRQFDRALLTVPGRYGKTIGIGETGIAYRCDLNGDRRVDQKDLAILTAPANYGKRDLRIEFTETTNVGENGI